MNAIGYFSMNRRWLGVDFALAPFLFCALNLPAQAAQTDIHGPLGSVAFGTSVTVLPNGNFVVTDPDGPVSNVGAVYLYNSSGALISTLMGSNVDDHVGKDGITVVGGGNFVVTSSAWNNGSATQAGAVTWVNGTTGTGPGTTLVSASNSLVGSSANDQVGNNGFAFFTNGVTVLSNGNYVVASPSWSNGATSSAGAATWANGSGGIVGAVSVSNSLVGTTANDHIGGGGITALSNGNYVVASPASNNGVAAAGYGAVTWGAGGSGIKGAVSASNSLVGSTVNDEVGATGTFGGRSVTALSNGNYVVTSTFWNNGSTAKAGAATWGNGNGGTTGPVSVSNSLVGTTALDNVGGNLGAIALTNGNYVVDSPAWHNGATTNAGAVTWGNGSTGTVGAVSVGNSLVGTTTNDNVGFANGSNGVAALTNGNYVVTSFNWNNGVANSNFGAATWGNGSGGTVGAVSASNSLVGSSAGDRIGIFGATPLTNGNYVVGSSEWNGQVGAASWCDGSIGRVGVVTFAGTLIGNMALDHVGEEITALSNGNYVIASLDWHNGAAASAGAATWSNGSNGTPVGFLSANNSLVGSLANDYVGRAIALSNGNYVVVSDYWRNGSAAQAGAVTWGNGNSGIAGPVSVSNSLVGTQLSDHVGGTTFGLTHVNVATALSDGNYVIASLDWNNGATTKAGAVTLANGRFRVKGKIQSWNSVLGTAMNGGGTMTYDYDAVRHRLAVGRPAENIVSLFTMDQIFAGDFDP